MPSVEVCGAISRRLVETAPGLIVTEVGVVVPASKTSLLILKFCSSVVVSAEAAASFQAKMTFVPAPGALTGVMVPGLSSDQLLRLLFQARSVVPRQ